MHFGNYANLTVDEGTLNGDKTITFDWKPKKIIITNDSATKTLLFKLNNTEDFATLNPTETVSLEVSARTLFLSSTGASYRAWGLG